MDVRLAQICRTTDPVNSESGISAEYLNFGYDVQGFSHGLGFVAPNSNYNFGADITLTPKVVSTTRLGYFFNNYHDFGWPTAVQMSTGATAASTTLTTAVICPYLSSRARAHSPRRTLVLSPCLTPASTTQFDENVAFFKSGWAGTHNLKVGYQYNHMSNVIDQNGNVPYR